MVGHAGACPPRSSPVRSQFVPPRLRRQGHHGIATQPGTQGHIRCQLSHVRNPLPTTSQTQLASAGQPRLWSASRLRLVSPMRHSRIHPQLACGQVPRVSGSSRPARRSAVRESSRPRVVHRFADEHVDEDSRHASVGSAHAWSRLRRHHRVARRVYGPS